MTYQINGDLIKSTIRQKGWQISETARKAGIGDIRLLHILNDDTYRMRLSEAKKLGKLIGMKVSEMGSGFNDEPRMGRKPSTNKPEKKEHKKGIKKPRIDRYPMKWESLKSICEEKGISRNWLSIQLGKQKNYLNGMICQGMAMNYDSIRKLAQELQCRISDISEVPDEMNANYRARDYRTADEIYKLPSSPYCGNLLSPVEVVKANKHESCDFAHWKSLPETPNYHIEYIVDGCVAFRYENGRAVLFANEYVKPSDIQIAMEQIKKWGEILKENT